MEIRPASRADIPFLAEMTLLAAFPPGPLPDGAADLPRVRRWTEGWGRPGDAGVVAWDGGERVGAAWCRFQDEAIVRDDQGVAPAEIAIAVVPSRRSRGVGGDLLAALDQAAVERGHQALCLTVSPMNPAVRLYERAGFETVSRDGSKIVMMARLAACAGSGLADERPPGFREGALYVFMALDEETFSSVALARQRCDPAMALLIDPHITLTPPFRDAPDLDAIATIQSIAARWLPITLEVGGASRFDGSDVVYLRVEPVEIVRQLHFDLLATGLFQPDPHAASWAPHMTISVAPGGAEQALDVAASLTTMKTVCRSLALVGPDASGRFVMRSTVSDGARVRLQVARDR